MRAHPRLRPVSMSVSLAVSLVASVGLIVSVSPGAVVASTPNEFTPIVNLYQSPQAGFSPELFPPSLGVSPAGGAVAVWQEVNPAGSRIAAASMSAATGQWSPVTYTSTPGVSAFEPVVAVNAAGNGLAVWIESPGLGERVSTSRFDVAAGAWSAPAAAGFATGEIGDLAVALADDGAGVVSWTESSIGSQLVSAARLPAGSSTWDPWVLLDSGFVYQPSVGVDASGNFIAVWERDDGSSSAVRSASLPAGATEWTSSVGISGAAIYASWVSLAVGPSGDAVAAWIRFLDGGARSIEVVRGSAVTGVWGTPRVLESGTGAIDEFVRWPSVDVNGAGDAVVVYERTDQFTDIRAARSPGRSEAWSAPVTVAVGANEANNSEPVVAVDDQGGAITVFNAANATQVRSSRLSVGGSAWSTPVRISPASRIAQAPDVGFDASGNAVAVWVSPKEFDDRIQAARRSTGRPVFVDATVGSPRVGAPFSDGVSASGTPSPIYSVLSGALPAGLSLDPTTGAITGTPTSAVAFDVVLAASNSEGRVTTTWKGAVLPEIDQAVPLMVPVEPFRVLDSRPGAGGSGRVLAGSVTEVPVAGVGSVPGGVAAVVLNVTVVGASSAGFATVFPCGVAPPEASNLNFVAGQTVPNAVVSKVGDGGKVCVFTDAETDLLVDVNGFIP